jgi:hypothetical protein
MLVIFPASLPPSFETMLVIDQACSRRSWHAPAPDTASSGDLGCQAPAALLRRLGERQDVAEPVHDHGRENHAGGDQDDSHHCRSQIASFHLESVSDCRNPPTSGRRRGPPPQTHNDKRLSGGLTNLSLGAQKASTPSSRRQHRVRASFQSTSAMSPDPPRSPGKRELHTLSSRPEPGVRSSRAIRPPPFHTRHRRTML